MTVYPKYIAVEKIARMMHFRVERLLQKIEKMQLKLTKSKKLNKQDATQLVKSFLYSKKTSVQTKRNAEILLNLLNDKEELSGNSTTKHMNLGDENSNIKSVINDKLKQIWYKKIIDSMTDFVIILFTPIFKMVHLLLQKSIQFLESDHFKFVALMVAIMVQMHHSAHWYLRISPEENTSFFIAFGYAFMVDLFILVVTLEGKLSIARTFATLTFLSNILYFLFWVNFSSNAQAYTNAISTGIMAYIIYAYTELFVKYRPIR